MKRIILILVFILGLVTTVVRAQEPLVTDNIGMVKANGSAVIDKGEKEAYQRALSVSRKNGVEKAILRFIPANYEKDSLYLKLLSNFDSFVGGDVKVYKSQKLNGKLLLFCEVPVNFELIQRELKQEVQFQQKQNRKDQIVFVVKLENYPKESVDALEEDCRSEFQGAFKGYNFRSLGLESAGKGVLELVSNHQQSYSFEELREKTLGFLKEEPGINLVLVGSLKVQRLENYLPNYYAEVEGQFEIIKLTNTGTESLGKLKEGFTALRGGREEALKVVTQAAAVKISKSLASITYNHWNSK